MGEIFRMVQRNQENRGKGENKGKGAAGQERAREGSRRDGKTGRGQREGGKRRDSDMPSPFHIGFPNINIYQHICNQ